MKLAVFSSKPYDKQYLAEAKSATEKTSEELELIFHEPRLGKDTVSLAHDATAVCVFVNDDLSAKVIESLAGYGVKAILLRCAGFNNVDLQAAQQHGIMVANVPSYSPEAVAEFAVGLIQTLNRNIHRAYNRVREGNFALHGLMGRTLHGKTVGIIGTGNIGRAASRIMKGFGCRVIAYDVYPSPAFKEIGEYRSLDDVLQESDIISLHCPLTEQTHSIINDEAIQKMKKGVMLVNTSRGGLVDTRAVIRGLKRKYIGGLALDVYEEEGPLFYEDHSGEIIEDDLITRLMTFHNVLVSGHQAFFTQEALREIAGSTLRNLVEFEKTGSCQNSLHAAKMGGNVAVGPVRVV
ncbi:hypothetical protein NLG97_g10084 [Lecanicillium saksenae]|uniref:Uncharacterized protein n=1 Tax=Lecanicillium saksenae TaxID=468837 RepID=A0ACC1QHE8_9HYPO|nr:hypothetical protein NLG97_g10084 [Lecanicillium saksenae]